MDFLSRISLSKRECIRIFLLVGSETHSYALDFSTRGRNVSVIFGDGAGAVVLQPTTNEQQGILSTHLHSDGSEAEILCMMNPGFHAGHFVKDRGLSYLKNLMAVYSLRKKLFKKKICILTWMAPLFLRKPWSNYLK